MGPSLRRIRRVWPVDLPSQSAEGQTMLAAPIDDGLVCVAQLAVGASMSCCRHLPGRQRGDDNRIRQSQVAVIDDANLNPRGVVAIEHEVGTAAADPRGGQSGPDLIEQHRPESWELWPGRRRANG